ncbi:glycoside hydrolase family 28 protein [Streptomyces clavuligerus]|uniref:Pectate lyase n=2 Tax=Streptomyces clavuligerus TaxID=1901 RepID=E2PY65_STRCL|nr:glycoside hydrolase family 28 protein [Streptomyces clavuligerus]ANW17286.1 glycoside hydrolase [Streptomyces clavuligerus]AXU11832.1 glycoside hydrolase family 28 protein [Streptomyces clavuligerus]EFG10241.1 Pectate lyase [Streptomyces clavuligerus]MBY6301670.1 glycoside hydrolase family 28 protein [Streptomyces clavuligerus]QCS04610.1 glycoside hydrolase [Streptomyces clavuligerus]
MHPHPSRRSALRAGGALAAGTVLPVAASDVADAQIRRSDPAAAARAAWSRLPDILDRIRPPRFPDRWFDITQYGAVGDGTTKNTAAIRAAITACHRAGGGHVLVPAGRFVTGAIHLRGGVDLHVSEGGILAFSPDPADYLPAVLTRWEGTECWNYSPFVYAHNQRGVAVTGEGILDGQARRGPWESWYRTGTLQGPDQRLLRKMGSEGVPVKDRLFGAGHYLRPKMVQFNRCRDVLISDLTIVDPPMWTVHPVLCTNVTVRNITVESLLHNTDGVDPEASRLVHITGCRFNTNDDCVAVKAGRDEDGHRVGVPSEDIVVQDCDFSGRWGGITVGSEMSGGVRRVFAEDCRINPPDFPGHYPVKYPVYLKASKKRGGFVDGVYVRRFSGQAVEREVLFVNMDYNGGEGGTHPVSVRDIHLSHCRIDGARAVLRLVGLETDRLRGVHLAHCDFTGVRGPDAVAFTEGLTRRRVTVNGVEVS